MLVGTEASSIRTVRGKFFGRSPDGDEASKVKVAFGQRRQVSADLEAQRTVHGVTIARSRLPTHFVSTGGEGLLQCESHCLAIG